MLKKFFSSIIVVSMIIFTSIYPVSAQQSSSSSEIQYFFTRANQNPQRELIKTINSSRQTLDIAIYGLTSEDIVSAIINAKKRRVKVRMITDKQEAAGKFQKKQLSLLKKNNIPIRVNTHKGLMHLKVSIVDNQTVTTGSYNYTKGASNYNDEVLVIIKNSSITKDFEAEFQSMWNNNDDYKDY